MILQLITYEEDNLFEYYQIYHKPEYFYSEKEAIDYLKPKICEAILDIFQGWMRNDIFNEINPVRKYFYYYFDKHNKFIIRFKNISLSLQDLEIIKNYIFKDEYGNFLLNWSVIW